MTVTVSKDRSQPGTFNGTCGTNVYSQYRSTVFIHLCISVLAVIIYFKTANHHLHSPAWYQYQYLVSVSAPEIIGTVMYILTYTPP